MFGNNDKTVRGFAVVAFTDQHGQQCSLQQSSAIGDADDAFDRPGSSFVWLGLDNGDPKIMKTDARALGMEMPSGPVTGWMPYPIPAEVSIATRMHLDREQVQGLIERLNKWLETGAFE